MPTLELIRVFDQPGPRYTSYPTADHFAEAFDAEKQAWWLDNRTLRQPGQPVTISPSASPSAIIARATASVPETMPEPWPICKP